MYVKPNTIIRRLLFSEYLVFLVLIYKIESMLSGWGGFFVVVKGIILWHHFDDYDHLIGHH